MADYRQFCGECGREVGFGYHAEGCLAPKKAAEAARRRKEEERREEDARKAPWKAIRDPEEFFEEMADLADAMAPLYEEYHEMKQEYDMGRRVLADNGWLHMWLDWERQERQ